MQDEQFIREWTQVHEDFTADVECALSRIGGNRPSHAGALCTIGSAYEAPVQANTGPGLSSAAQASLRGLAASVITFVLWVTVMLLATPAPGLAAPLGATAVQAGDCVTLPVALA